MKRSIQFAIGLIAGIAIISIGAFFYMTRAVAAPSTDIQSSAQQLEVSDDTTSDSIETLFRISQSESEVTYTIEEVLNGADFTVVGTTNEVAGDIVVNLSNPSLSEVGEIRINARTFATDEERRDNSVARFVLQSEDDANEFIIFTPTSLAGLPDSIAAGDTVTFQIIGDLTITGTTNSVTFDVTATLDTVNQLSGLAEATINYADFGLSIPEVPFVASVEDTVILSLNFVADTVID